MTFGVRWEESALEELTQLWTSASAELRKAITAATHRIDQKLQVDPNGSGESRPDNRRILFSSPLGVIFKIEAAGKTVSVLRVWLFRSQ